MRAVLTNIITKKKGGRFAEKRSMQKKEASDSPEQVLLQVIATKKSKH
jgi:hypothetical protein